MFVGRVVEQLETKSDEGGPYTPYKVVVNEVILNEFKEALKKNKEKRKNEL